ncbi:transposase, partial [Klebsiella pneumoniae]|uniref:transposase n=1 Tax=Klebsiella pneumoniae TaxID=573 RepID=UPI000A247E6B
MKDQITYLPDNADRSVAKQKFKITNWPTYNKALINRGSITFWLDDEAIQAWYESAPPSSRGSTKRYTDLANTTVIVINRVFGL